jgi:hypothetical protein
VFSHFSWTRYHQSQAEPLKLKVSNFNLCCSEYRSIWNISSICSIYCSARCSCSASPKNVGGWNFRNLSSIISSPRRALHSIRFCSISAFYLLKACPTVTSAELWVPFPVLLLGWSVTLHLNPVWRTRSFERSCCVLRFYT